MNPDTMESTPGTTDDEVLKMQVKMLRRHMGLPPRPGDDPPNVPPRLAAMFFIEQAPHSHRGSQCKLLPACDKGPIRPGEYRIALSPSMDYGNFMRGREGTADFYHVRCFEKIADFSQIDFVNRVEVVTRSTFGLRGVKANSILNGSYLVEGGVERLILQWKVERGRQIDERDGRVIESDSLAQNFTDLLNKAGQPGFQPEKPEGMSTDEYTNLMTTLAPNESDGPEDKEVWNLFDQYLFTRVPSRLDYRHDLSEMLKVWEFHTFLAQKEEDECNDWEREERANLGPKAIRAIRRLSEIPMPDLQSAFLRGW